MSIYLNSILIPLNDDVKLLIHYNGKGADKDNHDAEILPNGWFGTLGGDNKGILYKPVVTAGFQNLAIIENVRYTWELFTKKKRGEISTHLDKKESLFQYDRVDVQRGSICVRNFLGIANLSLNNEDILAFDVVSSKIDYESDYRSMVEAIAEECHQLLLKWNSPTTLTFISGENEHKTLLEQFIFLRHVLSSEKLDLFIETIHHNPHNKLTEEQTWQPIGTAEPHPRFFEDPLTYGDGWSNIVGQDLPRQIIVQRKYETFDTAPNRFIKFAITKFNSVCREIINHPKIKGTPVLEAEDMAVTLEGFLRLPIFDDVSDVTSLPLNNQTLQKREGYRDILHAWLMLDLAAQLDWEGRQDAFAGGSRDVPTLYEYWLFFKLRSMLLEIDDIEPNDNKAKEDSFITSNNHLTINLKQGKKSCCHFKFKESVAVDFYYNRSFSGGTDVLESGAYSRQFRPDYSLVIYPFDKKEADAEQDGNIAYLHFDAKYRVDKLTELFGEEEESDEKQLKEKQEEALSTYKRGDLYKMHTYNEAIRRTVGSYVLYPGNNLNNDSKEKQFKKYHELLPGVGAFALKPSKNEDTVNTQSNAIKNFIGEVLNFQQSKFSQLHRVNYYTHDTVREIPKTYTKEETPADLEKPVHDTNIALIPVRSKHILDICRNKQFLYVHAIDENGKHIKPNKNLLNSEYVFSGVVYEQISWYAKVKQWDIVPREKLEKDYGLENILKSKSTHYYTFELENIIDTNCTYKVGNLKPKVTKWATLFKDNQNS